MRPVRTLERFSKGLLVRPEVSLIMPPTTLTNIRLGILPRLLTLLGKPTWLLLMACLLPLVILAFSHVEVIDDAYITYRYAYNLARGQGLVFNPGEYVEGSTSLLWTLLMVVPEALDLPIHLFAAFLGVAFGLLALIATWRICRRVGISSGVASVAVLVLGVYPDFWLAVANGMEGGLFAFLLAHTTYLIISGRPTYAGLFGGLLFMARPVEAIFIIPVFVLYQLVAPENQVLPLQQRITARRLAAFLGPCLALVLAVALWRLAYYGAWVPNTITAKSMPLSELNFIMLRRNIYHGLLYWSGFLVSAAPLSLGALLAVMTEARRRPAALLCLAILASQVPVVLANGGDWMPHYRLLAIYAPLLAVLLAVAMNHIATAAMIRHDRVRLMIQLGFGMLLIVSSVLVLYHNSWDVTPYVIEEEPCMLEITDAARPALLPTDRITPEALGLMSYKLPDLYSHDHLGLTDSYIAHHGTVYVPRFGKSEPAYTYYTVRPELVIVHNGFGLLSTLARASNGTYNYDYSTYLLTAMAPACEVNTYMISIRKDVDTRILPAFAQLEPQRVTVPDYG